MNNTLKNEKATMGAPRRRQAPFRALAAIILSMLFLAPGSGSAGDAEVVVIVSKASSIQSITVDDLRRYYSDALLHWPNGESVKIFDLPMDDATRQVFSAKVLGKAPQDVTMDWANKRITNTAKNPPMILKSQVLMLSKVAGDANALGYMAVEQVDEQKVKVVLRIK